MKYEVLIGGARHSVELTREAGEPSRVTAAIDGRPVEADAVQVSPGVYSILLSGRSLEVRVEKAASGLVVHAAGHEYRVVIADPRSWRRRGGTVELEGRQQILAPMPGKVVRVLVSQGQQVETGQGLFVVEAMKMQNEIRSPKSGTVERLFAREGQAVNTGEVLAVVG
jgi:biotin carboxyl carrier protein